LLHPPQQLGYKGAGVGAALLVICRVASYCHHPTQNSRV
jgi:hypothetical protein